MTWLANRPGVRFEGYSTVIGATELNTQTSAEATGLSLEAWLQPERIQNSGTILAFYTHQSPSRFSLHQSLRDLEMRIGRQTLFYVDDYFRKLAPVFITITSGLKGTAVYSDGALAKRASGLQISATDFTGTVVLGDSIGQSDTWSGKLFGVALYHRQLVDAEVLKHYQTWVQHGRPKVAQGERNAALYLFDEDTGWIIHDRAGAGADLIIPERYRVEGKILLEPIWTEFELSMSYWGNAAKNVIGFIPLGFCFYTYFWPIFRVKRTAFFTIILGSLISLSIEILQGYLPTRDSGTTDLITNTFGTWIGVASYRLSPPILDRFSQWLVKLARQK